MSGVRLESMRVVLDTNVLVSALLKPGSVPDRAIAALWGRRATVFYDARIADEYRSVLARPKFRAIDPLRIEAMLAEMFARAQQVDVVAAWDGPLDDEGDRIFVELALSARADAIVTGNIKHYPLGLGFEVLPPATLLSELGGA
jgi:putative PIN family toxin of toxin-antitoxin system